MRYVVIAIHWDENLKKQVKYIAGTFDSWNNASIFRDAYNEYYSTNAVIKDLKAEINK